MPVRHTDDRVDADSVELHAFIHRFGALRCDPSQLYRPVLIDRRGLRNDHWAVIAPVYRLKQVAEWYAPWVVYREHISRLLLFPLVHPVIVYADDVQVVRTSPQLRRQGSVEHVPRFAHIMISEVASIIG